LTRPFAATFDLILSEYAGYTDETLLEVTLERLHQMREVILLRRRDDQETELLVRETELRAMMSTVQAAAGNKKGAKEASRFKLFERRKVKALASTERIMSMFGGGDDG
jgi:hypothetical protein